MAFKGLASFSHTQQDKIGVLLVNLGTPEAPTAAALRTYLREFLWDPRVVEIPRPLWWVILHGIILRIRPAKSAKNYASIWTEEGSPLLVHTFAQRTALEERFDENTVMFEVGCRYGNPSIGSAVERLLEGGARKLLVLPLYPQYCSATTGSTFDALAREFNRRRWLPELRFVSNYHDYDPYIDACCDAIKRHWHRHGRAEKLVLSYHGIPRFCLDKGDPYFCQCQKTSRLIGERLGIESSGMLTTFQSRFGKAEWLQPYTDKTLQSLPGEGITSVDVFCPGFAADCLETLEEIAVENKDYFLNAGGQNFNYIPALNASVAHIDTLQSLISNHTHGWLDGNIADPLRQKRARNFGAST
jgi:protoporphyrin/coproporphyrin ferrochelatase